MCINCSQGIIDSTHLQTRQNVDGQEMLKGAFIAQMVEDHLWRKNNCFLSSWQIPTWIILSKTYCGEVSFLYSPGWYTILSMECIFKIYHIQVWYVHALCLYRNNAFVFGKKYTFWKRRRHAFDIVSKGKWMGIWYVAFFFVAVNIFYFDRNSHMLITMIRRSILSLKQKTARNLWIIYAKSSIASSHTQVWLAVDFPYLYSLKCQ